MIEKEDENRKISLTETGMKVAEILEVLKNEHNLSDEEFRAFLLKLQSLESKDQTIKEAVDSLIKKGYMKVEDKE